MNDWRNNLSSFFDKSEKAKESKSETEMARFIIGVVMPAFEELAGELEKYGRTTNIRNAVTSAAFMVYRDGEEEITYRIQGRIFPNSVLPYAEIRVRERKGLKYVRVESMFRSGPQDYTLADVSKQEIIENFLTNYTRRVRPE